MPTLLDAIKTRERASSGPPWRASSTLKGWSGPRARGTAPRSRESLRGSSPDWRGILEGTPSRPGRSFRKLLVGRLTLSPTVREDGRYYEIAGKVSYGRLLTGIIGVQGLVPPG